MNKVFLNLGLQPLANSFLKDIKKNTLQNEFFYNLKICFNSKNYLVSIAKPVNPKNIDMLIVKLIITIILNDF